MEDKIANIKKSTISGVEGLIEEFVPKLFCDWKYTFEYGITVYVPKKYMNIINQRLSDSLITTRFRVLDIAERL